MATTCRRGMLLSWVRSCQAWLLAPKLAWRTTPLGGAAMRLRVMNGAAKVAAPNVLRKERRENCCWLFICVCQNARHRDGMRQEELWFVGANVSSNSAYSYAIFCRFTG